MGEIFMWLKHSLRRFFSFILANRAWKISNPENDVSF
jgi:hypothetical protein